METLEIELLDLFRKFRTNKVSIDFVSSELFRIATKYPQKDFDDLLNDLMQMYQ